MREEHRPPLHDDNMLRRMFGIKREEVTGGFRKLHTESFIIRNLP
jgi:hypothetical protein